MYGVGHFMNCSVQGKQMLFKFKVVLLLQTLTVPEETTVDDTNSVVACPVSCPSYLYCLT